MADEKLDSFSESLRADLARLRRQSSETRARVEELQKRIGALEKIYQEPPSVGGNPGEATSGPK